jgi:catechol 2,3-dioxygenase-like lactoylglutathione lyase family enzyme
MTAVVTLGIDHVGLTVRSLDLSLAFFRECLGWTQKGGKPEYPAAYVSDGRCMVTLWQIKEKGPSCEFDRLAHIGLHHLAFKVGSEAELRSAFERVAAWPGVVVEFAPEFSGKGPKVHFMINEPGGTRIEFAWDPR